MKYILFGVLTLLVIGGTIGGVEYFTGQKKAISSQTADVRGLASGEGYKKSDDSAQAMNEPKQYTSPPPMVIDVARAYTATLVTSKGTMRVVLFAKDTPATVNNFVFLAREGFYADTVFHRIIKGFMVQGGDPKGNGAGGPGYRFADEPVAREYTRGTIAMANAGPNTNGSQFFLMHADYPLPKNYVIFGSIDATDTESLATLDAIAATPVGPSGMGEESKPLEAVTLLSVTIEER